MVQKQHSLTTPAFMVYAKRKSANDPQAEMYLQFIYQFNKIDKSLGIRINYDWWDIETHSIKAQPLHNLMLQPKVDEYKQKVMGAYPFLPDQPAVH